MVAVLSVEEYPKPVMLDIVITLNSQILNSRQPVLQVEQSLRTVKSRNMS